MPSSNAPPMIREGQWITVGPEHVNGYVFHVFSTTCLGVGYIQYDGSAIKEDVVWENGRWEFMSVLGGSYLLGPDKARVRRGPSRP